ncbi:MAG: hypothetical protein CME62_06420 [Halobacteriovoraceae bacterium]|nr:hypothetical protein [Halobacteriovoraceae bacterium]|tara:strand:- start:3498 stop:4262 length:765 start_codon:yes stop_codon:yes gene_type:complete
MKSMILLLIFSLFLSHAWSVEVYESPDFNEPKQEKEYESVWEIEKENALTPFTNNTSAWILGTGTVLSYLVYREQRNAGKFGYDENHAEKVWCDWRCQGNIIGWGLLQVGYTLTQLPGIYDQDKKALENTEIMWKSTLYTSLYTLGLKIAVSQERPNSPNKYESFPSGHASAAFAFATNVAMRHAWYWNFLSVPLAYFVTASRVASDDHYIHDSVFGAALGISVAYGVNKAKLPLILGYEPMEDGGGIVMNYKF